LVSPKKKEVINAPRIKKEILFPWPKIGNNHPKKFLGEPKKKGREPFFKPDPLWRDLLPKKKFFGAQI